MKQGLTETLQLSHLGLRFVSRETEADYLAWHTRNALVFIRIGSIPALLSWLAMPVFVYFGSPDQWLRVLWVVSLVGLPAILTPFFLTYIVAARPILMRVVAACNVIAGCGIVWLIHEVVHFSGANTPYVTIVALILFFFAFMVFRLSLVMATAAVIPYVLLDIYFVWQDHGAGVIDAMELSGNLNALFAGMVSGMLVCAMLEILSRRSYVQQRTIESQQQLISRYVPPGVAEQITRGRAAEIDIPQRRQITVLFSDIVGSTEMADRIEPEIMTRVINEYVAAMVDIIDAHDGSVTEFTGDGLMAMYGAPDAMAPDVQAYQAIRSAQAMQSRLPELNKHWRRLGFEENLQIRIGINTGIASVGSYGSWGRMAYTAIGLEVNVAARIQAHCKPDGILLSEATYQALDGQIQCKSLGEVECKGVHYPVKVYAPIKIGYRPP